MNSLTPPCPSCGPDAPVTCRGKKYAVYPAGCLMMIGLPLAILHQTSSPMEYLCGQCQRRFGVRSTLAKFALGILIAIPLLLAGCVVYVLLNP
jgi:hypothetical protein